MKRHSIYVEGEFTTLNEYIQIERGNKFAAASIKKTETERLLYCRYETFIEKYPVKIEMTWYRKNKRSDPDNISFAQKFILDGLVAAKFLSDDGWNEIESITHRFELCDNPGVNIVIIER